MTGTEQRARIAGAGALDPKWVEADRRVDAAVEAKIEQKRRNGASPDRQYAYGMGFLEGACTDLLAAIEASDIQRARDIAALHFPPVAEEPS